MKHIEQRHHSGMPNANDLRFYGAAERAWHARFEPIPAKDQAVMDQMAGITVLTPGVEFTVAHASSNGHAVTKSKKCGPEVKILIDEYGFKVNTAVRRPVIMPKEVVPALYGFGLKPGTPETIRRAADPFIGVKANRNA
jgi:hypothetical protein